MLSLMIISTRVQWRKSNVLNATKSILKNAPWNTSWLVQNGWSNVTFANRKSSTNRMHFTRVWLARRKSLNVFIWNVRHSLREILKMSMIEFVNTLSSTVLSALTNSLEKINLCTTASKLSKNMRKAKMKKSLSKRMKSTGLNNYYNKMALISKRKLNTIWQSQICSIKA